MCIVSASRLAALEIGRFQDQLIRKLTDEMNAQLHHEGNGPATGAVIVPQYHNQDHEWTFARAFLYSITVLTTIGKCVFIGPSIHSQHIYCYTHCIAISLFLHLNLKRSEFEIKRFETRIKCFDGFTMELISPIQQ